MNLIVEELRERGIHNPWRLAYQSRVGPVEWLQPYTDATIREMGADGVHAMVAVPISFVSEHIETLEEIDQEYRELAHESGIEGWARVPALGVNKVFIDDLAEAVLEALPFVGSMAQQQGASPSGPDPLVRGSARRQHCGPRPIFARRTRATSAHTREPIPRCNHISVSHSPHSALAPASTPVHTHNSDFAAAPPRLDPTPSSRGGAGPAWQRRGPPRHLRQEAPRAALAHRYLALGLDAQRGDLERPLCDDGHAAAPGLGVQHGDRGPAPPRNHSLLRNHPLLSGTP